jgi:hypothetical protein
LYEGREKDRTWKDRARNINIENTGKVKKKTEKGSTGRTKKQIRGRDIEKQRNKETKMEM